MSKKENYSKHVVEHDGNSDEESEIKEKPQKRSRFGDKSSLIQQARNSGSTDDPMKGRSKIIDREDQYMRQKYQARLSPDRADPLAAGSKDMNIDGIQSRSFQEIMKERELDNERIAIQQKIAKQKQQQKEEKKTDSRSSSSKSYNDSNASQKYDGHSTTAQSESEWDSEVPSKSTFGQIKPSKWDSSIKSTTVTDATPGRKSRWDVATPQHGGVESTPGASVRLGGNFAETPTPSRMISSTPMAGETPGSARRKHFWDEKTPQMGMTPGNFNGMTPTPGGGATPFMNMAPEKMQAYRWELEVEERNRPLSDAELDSMLPGLSQGYEIVKPPESYKPLRPNIKKLITPQTPAVQTPQIYQMPGENKSKPLEIPLTPSHGDLPALKYEDITYFGALMNTVDEKSLNAEELKERKIMMLLLKIKNGTPQMRKSALRQITQNARELGAGALFNQILPLLMSATLQDQERHLLVKVIDRILYQLEDMVRPYVHKILVVIEPLLIDEDYYARVEGREIISNLAKAAGLTAMITSMRPDIDHNDEYVRNTTARAFAVVASSLGIPQLLPFLKAICQTKKSWQARHTGIKIVQQTAILMGCAILPHLKSLVEIIEHGLQDEQTKVRTITALAIAALAEAATPYGIEAFQSVLTPLWQGIEKHRSKSLAAFLKAIGFIIPLMDDTALAYTKFVMRDIQREFDNQQEEMKKIVLKVVKQIVSCSSVDAPYTRVEIMPDFFRCYWIVRMASDKRNYRQLVDTTIEIAMKVGGAEILERIVPGMKNDNENYRKMVMETIEKIVGALGISDVDTRLEEQLMDGILTAFHEQISDDTQIMLNGFGTVVNALGQRAKPYFPQICGVIQFRLQNKSARVRQQGADLIARIALAMKNCGEELRLGGLGVKLFENLGEEYPEVLGSILGGLKAIVNVIGMTKMTPPIKDLLPRLTPILKNRHEKVQENCIDLIGRIADRGSEYVSPKEWMRICFDLLDLLKAHQKGIRRATVNTFGYIAKAIGPQDVLVTLLNNLKVQERQLRVCTTVAIAIVAETCGPFNVLPALMNEYRVQELNVQNGVLKSLSFIFEYIGEMAQDYVYAVVTLLEDALTDRDLVHRQTAGSAVKHLTLGVQSMGCEDALVHLLNYVWPNIFETSPHVVNAVTEAIEAMRVSLGPGFILLYLLQGLFHPAQRVRYVYWRLYNMLYTGSQDALVAFYPDISDDSTNKYSKHELMNML